MAVRRDKNTGEPIEKPTVKFGFDRPERRVPGLEEKSTLPGENAGRGGGVDNSKDSLTSGDALSPFEAPTEKIRVEQNQSGDADRTRLIQAHDEDSERWGKDPMEDPIVGWLVVIAGPGKGQVCPLGYGSNSLGRGNSSRVLLDFGDDLISREEHAMITYDSRGRKFYLQHGGGKNLTYLGEEPVLTPTLLENAMEFSIGRTTLRFVPLCGPGFDWEDMNVE